jgi:D-lactate dehydrogenase
VKIAMFDTHGFERERFSEANRAFNHDLTFFEARLTSQTASLAGGFEAVCSFVNDRLDRDAIALLKQGGTRLIALRSAGFNQVDLVAAAESGIPVVRVPEYSPYAVAEHAVALILGLDRKIPRAHARVRDGNFSLNGLVGFDLHGKTVGVLGTGKIGSVLCRIISGFGCRVLGYDAEPSPELISNLGVRYESLSEIYSQSDVISLHLPLTPSTRHIIDEKALAQMKSGVMLINTGRGSLIDSRALIGALKSGQVGYAGLDVYEEEEGVFFQDLSDQVLQDDVLARLLTFPNVLVTSHQAFLTREALQDIAETTLANVRDFELGRSLRNLVRVEDVIQSRPREAR